MRENNNVGIFRRRPCLLILTLGEEGAIVTFTIRADLFVNVTGDCGDDIDRFPVQANRRPIRQLSLPATPHNSIKSQGYKTLCEFIAKLVEGHPHTNLRRHFRGLPFRYNGGGPMYK